MHIDFLIAGFEKSRDKTALICNDKKYTFGNLIDSIYFFKKELSAKQNIPSGSTVLLEGDFTFNTISLLLALTDNNCIIVPLNSSSKSDRTELTNISESEYVISVNDSYESEFKKTGVKSSHEYINKIRDKKNPGLILFSSGTSGKPKAAVHDFSGLLKKFRTKREALITLNFLLFDHWGGLNTLFHTLSNSGTTVATSDRSPDNICRLIEEYKIELLPSSPTFLNLLLLSETYKRYDLKSLKTISYGTESMSPVTLRKLNTEFPFVKFRQTYGLIETGVLRTKSKDDNSLWLKLGGEGFDVRVRDSILQIKSESNILGYMNYPSPFTEDGYFITGDEVETDGEYYRILGRKSEQINIGGEKVYPAEIENVIRELENVADAVVYGEKNPVTGNIICADVRLLKDENASDFRVRLKKFCMTKLRAFKIPSRVKILEEIKFSERFKRTSNKS
ncbi:MAG: long-chain fatty acid--CoA ligase [Ignavibacteria bacterium]|nr:long-chain fatty acid--CoA ligase [Ignavibacteria bacterium]